MENLKKQRFMKNAFRKFERILVRYAMSLLGDIDKARDVVQDTFLRLWETEQATVENHLAPWLFTVCRNRALDIYRKEKSMKQQTEYSSEVLQRSEAEQERIVDNKKTTSYVLSILKNLPQNQKDVLRLKFQNDLSYQEISRITGLTVSNVGYLIHMGIKAIRTKVESNENNLRYQ